MVWKRLTRTNDSSFAICRQNTPVRLVAVEMHGRGRQQHGELGRPPKQTPELERPGLRILQVVRLVDDKQVDERRLLGALAQEPRELRSRACRLRFVPVGRRTQALQTRHQGIIPRLPGPNGPRIDEWMLKAQVGGSPLVSCE